MKGNEVATSSHRQDYKPYGADVKPDTAVRRNALSKSEVSWKAPDEAPWLLQVAAVFRAKKLCPEPSAERKNRP